MFAEVLKDFDAQPSPSVDAQSARTRRRLSFLANR